MPALRASFVLSWGAFALLAAGFVYFVAFANLFPIVVRGDVASSTPVVKAPVLDKDAYNAKLLALAHVNASAFLAQGGATTTGTTTRSELASRIATSTASTTVWVKGALWPVKTAYPNAGALLPFNRIVAYYGNFYSTGMGVLGEYPPNQVLAMLASTTAQWQAADPSTPVIPAIDYIAVTAQASAGADGMYRARMPASQIQKAIDMAAEINGIVVLDVQVGKSTLQKELPLLQPFLQLPNVELAVDPEFSMKYGNAPGTVIGTFDASDINYAADYLAQLVREYHVPPKILVVHRFTQDMVTHTKEITPLPEVQVVMDMDGWGSQAKKIGTYTNVIADEPVQFTGFKLFYKNDIKPPSTGMLTPQQILQLTPAPSFIQYQ